MAKTRENFSAVVPNFPGVAGDVASHQAVYVANKHRIYSLAFWMTGSELSAEVLLERTFARALRMDPPLHAEMIDRCLVAELRQCMELGEFTLDCAASEAVVAVRRNTRRVDLENAVIALPATEKLIFLLHDVESCDCERVARVMRLSQTRCMQGLHQARLRLRELLAAVVH